MTLPVTLPVAAGAKTTFKVADCPGVTTSPADTPLALKPAPETLMFEMVTLELPEFVSVTGRVLLALVFTFPKFKLVGLALGMDVAAFTGVMAAVVVTLLGRLLTTK